LVLKETNDRFGTLLNGGTLNNDTIPALVFRIGSLEIIGEVNTFSSSSEYLVLVGDFKTMWLNPKDKFAERDDGTQNVGDLSVTTDLSWARSTRNK